MSENEVKQAPKRIELLSDAKEKSHQTLQRVELPQGQGYEHLNYRVENHSEEVALLLVVMDKKDMKVHYRLMICLAHQRILEPRENFVQVVDVRYREARLATRFQEKLSKLRQETSKP